MFRVALSNAVASAARITGMYSGSPSVQATQQANYPMGNIRTPERPGMPWRTTTTESQSVAIDFGVPVAMDALALIHCNFATALLMADPTGYPWTVPAWGPRGVTVEKNRWNQRYQTVIDGPPPPTSYRHLRLVIPAQTPLDGAGYFSLGGLFVGSWTEAPRDVKWGYRVRTKRPIHDEQPEHGGWRERSSMGMALSLISCERQVIVEGLPSADDQLAAWQTLEAGMASAKAFLLQIEGNDPAQCWMARLLTGETDWAVDPCYPEAPLEMEEVVG